MSYVRRLPWGVVVLVCLTLGLAPFVPQPHLVEKLLMLAAGELHRAIDVGDLLMHGSPWFVLLLKAGVSLRDRASGGGGG